jgi:hypothetical protein
MTTEKIPSHLQPMPRDFVQNTAFEINSALATLHREVGAWRDFTLGGTYHDAQRVLNCLGHTIDFLRTIQGTIEDAVRTQGQEQ